MKIFIRYFLFFSIMAMINDPCYAQRDPQFTQYMYNTMSINPAYAGSKDFGSLALLGRTQWVGFDGSPTTQTLSYHTPMGNNLGLGFNLANDALGPSEELFVDANVSYTIATSRLDNLSFGLRLGARMLNIDWSKGRFRNEDVAFNQDINNRFLPTIGAGLYYYTNEFYLGLSVPNILSSEYYDDNLEAFGIEALHYFLIAGYVFDLTYNIKFKPAILSKIVSGAPISVDVSANFMFYDRFTFGLAYRWDDALSGLVNFHLSERLQIGYAYDLTTSNFQNYNSGTHEVMLVYNLVSNQRFRSPRFF